MFILGEKMPQRLYVYILHPSNAKGLKIGEIEHDVGRKIKIMGQDKRYRSIWKTNTYTIHFDGSLSSWDIEKVNQPTTYGSGGMRE